MISVKKMYEAAIINRGGCDGEVGAPNGSMRMKIDRPGVHSEGASPEQLFAAGYASYFNDTVQHMLEESNPESDPEVKAWVSLFQLGGGGYQVGVVLEVSLPGLEEDQAERIAEEACAFCPYSKVTRGNIGVEVTIVGQGTLNVTISEIMKDPMKKR